MISELEASVSKLELLINEMQERQAQHAREMELVREEEKREAKASTQAL